MSSGHATFGQSNMHHFLHFLFFKIGFQRAASFAACSESWTSYFSIICPQQIRRQMLRRRNQKTWKMKMVSWIIHKDLLNWNFLLLNISAGGKISSEDAQGEKKKKENRKKEKNPLESSRPATDDHKKTSEQFDPPCSIKLSKEMKFCICAPTIKSSPSSLVSFSKLCHHVIK